MLDTKAVGDILKYIHVREERVFLKNHRCIAVVRRYTLDVLVIQKDFPIIGFIETCDHAKKRRLPAAGRPQKGDEVPFFEFQIHILDDMILPKIFIDFLQL